MRSLLLAALSSSLVSAFLPPPFFNGRREDGFTSHLHENVLIDPALLASGLIGSDTVTQKQDHFDTDNKITWEQRYFYNQQYASNDSTVNVLYLSGEQVASTGMLLSGAYMYYAKVFNASLYALEHRYYGNSRPTDDVSTENLRFLSSRQAIEDIAAFIRFINEEKGGDQKWIVVGGSYAGALAAWSRLKHPELIAGALSSSGPILAQMDFYGYLETVENVFKKIGGLCYDQIAPGFEAVGQLLQSAEGRATLSKTFRIVPALSTYEDLAQNDIDNLYNYLMYNFMMAAQYSTPTPASLCKKYTIHGADYDPLQALAIVTPTLFNINFENGMQVLNSTSYSSPSVTSRLWYYQTCAEFGYFQTTDKGTNAFGATRSTRTFLEYCTRLFDMPVDQVRKNIDATNEHYGGHDYFAGTNVVFSHGTQDPWTYLAKQSDSKHWSVVIVEIENGAHCSDIGYACDTNPSYDLCNDNMKQVQRLTLENMKRWLDPVFPVPDRIEIGDHVGKRPYYADLNVAPITTVTGSATTMTRAKRSSESHPRKIDYKKWNKFTGKGQRIVPPPVSYDKLAASVTYGQGWFEQTWDHFNPNEDRTFQQQWFYNYCGTKDGPNFLMIGGEGPEGIGWVVSNMAWNTYAKEVNANLFVLEHRYYGKSKLGTNDLQYLTSAQMLYDVATFIRTMQVKQNLTGPWITFGGSYPGALAAWSREWFPELIAGAVGSSGPVLAKNDFFEYLEVVEDVVQRQSQKCFDRTSEAFEKLRRLSYDPEGRSAIQEKFNLYPAWTGEKNETVDPLDLANVFVSLYGLYQGTVQYNSIDWQDIQDLCAPFESDEYEDALDALRAMQVDMYGDENIETSSSFDGDLAEIIDMKNYVDGKTIKYSDDDLAAVLWTWQTCNEFGYYQTTDYGEGIFGNPVNLNYFIVMCERVFGVGMGHVENAVSRSNYQYGGRDRYNATNVVLPNGDADPWHALGITEQANLDESVVPILIPGTSHCADMYGTSAIDTPELIAAKQTILSNIKKWLAPAPPPTVQTTESTVTSTTSTKSSASTSTSTKETMSSSTKKTETTTQSSTTTTSGSTTTSSAHYQSIINVFMSAVFIIVLGK